MMFKSLWWRGLEVGIKIDLLIFFCMFGSCMLRENIMLYVLDCDCWVVIGMDIGDGFYEIIY